MLRYHLKYERGSQPNDVTKRHAAAMCGISFRQYMRYENGQANIPESNYRLMQIMGAGQLEPINRRWAGWILKKDLISPENVTYTPGEIKSLPYLYALIAELREQLNRPQQHDFNLDKGRLHALFST